MQGHNSWLPSGCCCSVSVGGYVGPSLLALAQQTHQKERILLLRKVLRYVHMFKEQVFKLMNLFAMKILLFYLFFNSCLLFNFVFN